MQKKMVVAAFLIVAMAVIMIGCSKGDGFGAPGEPDELAGLADFTGTFVANEDEAQALISQAGLPSMISSLKSVSNTNLYKFIDKVQPTANGAELPETAIDGKESNVSITGTASGSISGNIADYLNDKEGGSYSSSGSINATYELSKTNAYTGYSDVKVWGVVKVENSSSGSGKVTAKEGAKTNVKYESSSDGTQSIAVALVLDSPTYGAAKITFSAAKKTDSSSRASSGSTTYDISDVKVYNKGAGDAVYTLGSEYSFPLSYDSASGFAPSLFSLF